MRLCSRAMRMHSKHTHRHLTQWRTHVRVHTRRWTHALMYAAPHTCWQPKTHTHTHKHTSSWLNNIHSQGRFRSGHCITQKWRTVLKLLHRGGRAGGLQTEKVSQRWHQQKQYYHAVQCSWFGLLSANKDHYPSQCSFTHIHQNESLSFDECLRDTHNYLEMRQFIILWLLKPNAKWLVSSKEQLFYLLLCFIMVSYSCPCLSDKVQQLVGIFSCGKAALPHPPLPLRSPHPWNIKAGPHWNFKPILALPSYLQIQ